MTGKRRDYLFPTAHLMLEALHSRGFFLVVDLPMGTTIRRRRGMFVVRFP